MLLIAALYISLTLGAVSMAYPFLLMLAMATTGRGDNHEFRLIPRYWVNETALFRKYLLDHVPTIRAAWRPTDKIPADSLATWFGRDDWFEPRDVREQHLAWLVEMPAAQRSARAQDLRTFINGPCPREFRLPTCLFDADSALALTSGYQVWLQARYGSIEAVNLEYMENAEVWKDLSPVMENLNRPPGGNARERDWRALLDELPPEQLTLFDADASVIEFLRGRELLAGFAGARNADGNIVRAKITFDQLNSGLLGNNLRTDYYRKLAPLRYVRVDTARATPAWREFVAAKHADPATPLTERMPVQAVAAGLWGLFVQQTCPPEALRLDRPEDSWLPFLRQRYGSLAALNAAWGASFADWQEARIPRAVLLYEGFLKVREGLRWRYLSHNFRAVFGFIAIHGSALRVTVIYILLTILAALTVNPLAAYAMSRFRLKETHHILVFLLATMAFPGEVLMIPAFLQIKSFPLAQILTVALCLLAFYVLTRIIGRRLPLLLSTTMALAVTVWLSGWAVPGLLQRAGLGTSVNLMNSFWALLLPSLANGYGIFLLKGFFDSLPPELYEAGLIDGASEIRMFWQITLPLCKPILAVIALGAFGGAYGAFMHAFLICQDPKMWTLMVFLYEFQQQHIVSMVMASLVVAALPTLLVFVFCQNIILRGIVIPQYK